MKLEPDNLIIETLRIRTNAGKPYFISDDSKMWFELAKIRVLNTGERIPTNSQSFDLLNVEYFSFKGVNPWNSHDSYIEIYLPSPSINYSAYKAIRNTMIIWAMEIINDKRLQASNRKES